MKIESVYVTCHRYDIRFARVCIASVRAYYPDIPIFLLKECLFGDFSTTELEKIFNVSLYHNEGQFLGWGFNKLPVLFQPGGKRLLVIDSDIIFVGPVLDRLNQYDEDFVVIKDPQWEKEDRERHYYKSEAVREMVSDYKDPGFTFNAGQIVATSGLIKQTDFEPYIEFSNPPRLKYPEYFVGGDQGVTNLVIQQKYAKKEISVRIEDFMLWATSAPEPTELDSLQYNQTTCAKLVHYIGHKKRFPWNMHGAKLFLHFERVYYRQVSWGSLKRIFRILQPLYLHRAQSFRDKLRTFIDMLGLLKVIRRFRNGNSGLE